ERDDSHEVAVAQLAGDGAEDAGAARVVLRVDQHGGVLVEGDVGAVRAPELLARANHDRLHDLPLLNAAPGARLLHGRSDHVADARVAAVRAALDADAEQLARARVVRHLQFRLLLDHGALPCLLHYFQQAPALAARNRPRLDHPHHVALARLVGL